MSILIFIYIHVWWEYVFLYVLPYSDTYYGLDILILSGYISLYTCTWFLPTNKCSRGLNEWNGNYVHIYIYTSLPSLLVMNTVSFSWFPPLPLPINIWWLVFSALFFFWDSFLIRQIVQSQKGPLLGWVAQWLAWNTYPLKSLSFADYDSRPRIIRIPWFFVTTMSFTVHWDSREELSCRGLPPTRVWPLAASDRTHHDPRGGTNRAGASGANEKNWWTLHVWFLSLLHLMKHYLIFASLKKLRRHEQKWGTYSLNQQLVGGMPVVGVLCSSLVFNFTPCWAYSWWKKSCTT